MSNDSPKMTKQELLDSIHTERGLLEATLSRMNHSLMLIPSAVGIWTIKDVLAHISTWERWMIDWTNSLLKGENPSTPDPWDIETMNTATYNRVKDLTLSDVLTEFRQSYWDSLALVGGLSEEQLQQEHSTTWPMGPLWTGIAANMIWHYKEHRLDIQKWLAGQKKVS